MYPQLCRLIFVPLIATLGLHAVVLKAPSPSSTPGLLQLTRQAGYIFSGTVLSIEQVQPKGQSEVATVRVTFHVDVVVRGLSSRETFSILEWAGLWGSGDGYHPGERVLLFLYPSSRLGLSSPVNGSFGHFKLDSNGRLLLDAQRMAGLQIDNPISISLPGKKVSINSRDLVRAIRQVGNR